MITSALNEAIAFLRETCPAGQRVPLPSPQVIEGPDLPDVDAVTLTHLTSSASGDLAFLARGRRTPVRLSALSENDIIRLASLFAPVACGSIPPFSLDIHMRPAFDPLALRLNAIIRGTRN